MADRTTALYVNALAPLVALVIAVVNRRSRRVIEFGVESSEIIETVPGT